MSGDTPEYAATTPTPALTPTPPTAASPQGRILVEFTPEGEAAISMGNVSPQNILTAGALLTAMANHLLEARFVAAEREQLAKLQQEARQQALVRKVAEDLRRERG